MGRKRLFGELEWNILQLVRSMGEVSVRQIYEALDQTVAYTTVMTIMARLEEKGDLQRKREGRLYLYKLRQNSSSMGLIERLKKRLFGGRSMTMIRYLIDSSDDLTDQDLEEMKKLLKKKRES